MTHLRAVTYIRDLSFVAALALATDSGFLGNASAQTAPGDFDGQPLPITLMVPGGITYNNINEASYTYNGVPNCANSNGSVVPNGQCSPAEVSAGDSTIALADFNSRAKISSIPSGLSAPGSLSFINASGSYLDATSPTGVSNFNASIPLNAFATSSSVTDETARATTAEAGLATGLTQEVSRAQSAETLLGAGLTNETSRAETAEAGLTTGLSHETNRAQSAEAGLATGLSNETTRAQQVESNLGAAISQESQARIADVFRLTRGFRQATAGAIALSGMGFLPGKRLNLTVNMGEYEGEWALAAQGAYVLNEHAMLNAGVTTSTTGSGTGARAGLTLGW